LSEPLKIVLRDAEEALSLFGPHDVFLKRIEAETPAKIVTRGGELAISGSPEEQKIFVSTVFASSLPWFARGLI